MTEKKSLRVWPAVLILFGAAYFLGWRTRRLLLGEAATPAIAELRRDLGEWFGDAARALQRLRDDLWSTGGRRDDTTLLMVSRRYVVARTRGKSRANPGSLKS